MSQSSDQTTSMGHWIRQRLLRENLFSALKTFTWLGPLTLLIWVYAERAQIVDVNTQPITFDVISTDHNKFVRLEGEKNLLARLSGPRSRIDELQKRIEPTLAGPSVHIPIDTNNLSTGQAWEYDAAPLIALSRVFQSSGVSISDCKPARLKVFVDEYEERELTVQTPITVTNLTGANYTPAKVTVRAPKSYFAKADADLGGPGLLKTVEADLSKANVLDKPGQHEVSVPLRAPQLSGENVTYVPDHVTAKLDVRSADKTITLRPIVVDIEAPAGNFLDTYKVSCDLTIPELTLTGPPDKIDALAKEEATKPWAVLKLTGEDKPIGVPSSTKPKFLEFRGIPEGVRIDGGSISINFTLTERASQ